MIFNFSEYEIYIVSGVTDMRMGMHSLAAIVENKLELESQDKNIFIFCSRSKRIIKILLWEDNGFWLFQKKLLSGNFRWLTEGDPKIIPEEDLNRLLNGQDIWRRIPKIEGKIIV